MGFFFLKACFFYFFFRIKHLRPQSASLFIFAFLFLKFLFFILYMLQIPKYCKNSEPRKGVYIFISSKLVFTYILSRLLSFGLLDLVNFLFLTWFALYMAGQVQLHQLNWPAFCLNSAFRMIIFLFFNRLSLLYSVMYLPFRLNPKDIGDLLGSDFTASLNYNKLVE